MLIFCYKRGNSMVQKENDIKMIVSSLEGALLNFENKISFKTQNVLLEKKKHGKYIVAVTDRALTSAKYVMGDFSFLHFLITNHGAAIYDCEKQCFVWQDTFFIETAIQLFETYYEKCTAFQIGSTNYAYRCSKAVEVCFDLFVLPVKDFSSLLDNNIAVCQVELVGIPEKDIDFIVKEIQKKYPLLSCSKKKDWFSPQTCISITKKEVSPARAIRKLQEMLFIKKHDTVLFGSKEEDTSMLSCGYSVAMEGASAEVLKICKDVTDSCDNHGIVRWLDKHDM